MLATYLAYCIDKELYHAIDYLREQRYESLWSIRKSRTNVFD